MVISSPLHFSSLLSCTKLPARILLKLFIIWPINYDDYKRARRQSGYNRLGSSVTMFFSDHVIYIATWPVRYKCMVCSLLVMKCILWGILVRACFSASHLPSLQAGTRWLILTRPSSWWGPSALAWFRPRWDSRDVFCLLAQIPCFLVKKVRWSPNN